MSETTERDSICRLAKSLFERGLTIGSSGNISVRLDDGWLMTPTGSSMGNLDPNEISKLDLDGNLISGKSPTKESFLHIAMYDERPNSGAVVHLHSTHSVAVSCLADIDKNIDELGENSKGYNRDGLRAVAHLGGIGGMKKYVESKGQYDPEDQLGTSLSDYYDKFSGDV